MLMDINGNCGTVGLVVMMVMAVERVAALIGINLFDCVFSGGISVVCIICGVICCACS